MVTICENALLTQHKHKNVHLKRPFTAWYMQRSRTHHSADEIIEYQQFCS